MKLSLLILNDEFCLFNFFFLLFFYQTKTINEISYLRHYPHIKISKKIKLKNAHELKKINKNAIKAKKYGTKFMHLKMSFS